MYHFAVCDGKAGLITTDTDHIESVPDIFIPKESVEVITLYTPFREKTNTVKQEIFLC